MGSDGGTLRPRPLPRPELPPGPLRDLKDAVYELYLAASPLSLDVIHARIHALADASDVRPEADPTSTPKRDVIRDVISGGTLPPNVRHVVAVVAALLHHEAGPAVVQGHPEIERVRKLWRHAAAQRPLGRLISEVSPGDLEVHVAGLGQGHDTLPELPPYVVRPHDRLVRHAVEQAMAGRSAIAILVSDSTSGKTRACYEALHWTPDSRTKSLAGSGWHVWPAISPADVQAVIRDLPHVGPRTVVWLNEIQRYLHEPESQLARQVADGLRELLAARARGPVLVLGTLWPDLWSQLTRRPQSREEDTFASIRLLLDGRCIPLPDTFTDEEREAARNTGDPRLIEAADRAEDGAVTQYLAGVPDLLQRYELARPAVKAVIHAAMDARRLGHSEWLTASLLRDIALSYLDRRELRKVERTPDWFAEAISELTRLGDADTSVLTADARSRYRLEGYLDQHGGRNRMSVVPSEGFWDGCIEHCDQPDDLASLAKSAQWRHRLKIAAALYSKASRVGHPYAPVMLAEMRSESGHSVVDEKLYRDAADAGHPYALLFLAEMKERAGDHDGAERIALNAARNGRPAALARLVELRERAGDREDAERLAHEAADARQPTLLGNLVMMRERAGDHEDAERLAQQSLRSGPPTALTNLARMRERAGDRQAAERLAGQAARAGHPDALAMLAEMRAEAGDRQDAQRLTESAARAGHPDTLATLGMMREQAGDDQGAEELYRKAIEAGHLDAFTNLAIIRERSGDRQAAEDLALRAAQAGHPDTLARLGMMREQAGDDQGAEELYRKAINAGHLDALNNLAIIRERAGDREDAERLAQQSLRNGSPTALARLARTRERAGDHRGAERLAEQAAQAGHPDTLATLAMMREQTGDHASGWCRITL
ncbi:TPR repeat protein [Kibdelosporangium banguiense]|uniref:TPR repeat protein n=1 Tax=Kibdelosporangium banguiense TaxID=1365924 RepID=A0ABS4U0B1_9PSEU|nr:tetratricopeptide repeat protein [Kibdelosporangium banguiense]MBP2330094.1 TPR repeat protein [Kibdelosporangium banguiense]